MIREEPDQFNSYRPPNYYGSGRMDEEYSECDSPVNGVSAGSINGGAGVNGYHHTLPSHHTTPYARSVVTNL